MIVSILLLAVIAILVVWGMRKSVFSNLVTLGFWVLIFVASYLLFPFAMDIFKDASFFTLQHPVPSLFVFTILFIVLFLILKIVEVLTLRKRRTRASTKADKFVGALVGFFVGVFVIFVILISIPSLCFVIGGEVFTSIGVSIQEAPLSQFLSQFNFLEKMFL